MNRLKKSIKTGLIAMLIAITSIQIHNIHSVNATDPSDVIAGNIDYEGNYADDITSTYKTTSSKWYATYGKGTGYKGQGVLIYMLTNEGEAVPGVTPKAFPCSSAVKSITLNAKDKYCKYVNSNGDGVTTWESKYPEWASVTGYGGRMMINTTKVNTGAIKEWLLTEVPIKNSDKTTRNGIKLVQKLWGAKIAEQFVNKEIVLVVEPIIAVQYAQRAAINNALTLRG